MKLKGLDDKIQPILADDPKAVEAMPTYRRIFLTSIGNAGATSIPEAVKAYGVLEKFKGTEADIALDASELEIVRAIMNTNPLRLPIAIMGPVCKKLDEAESN